MEKKTLFHQTDDIIQICNAVMADASAADKGNKAAGRRLRTELSRIGPIVKTIRNQSLGKGE